jgi:hypothetical protein
MEIHLCLEIQQGYVPLILSDDEVVVVALKDQFKPFLMSL